ncbi:hypothetical protein [Pseudonocardia endophytica]|uniref:DUF4386 domain-containing protein n=1 Tax=Pseudonocardia endophytica TaxID=401976 RepID=A0A4R1HNE6_PSEEN|nr:hypothetical protein [Pseudonocardia endophytica]TCK22613.1 hypothetical protein EV378_6621 [Pseudonocardia endophytica]
MTTTAPAPPTGAARTTRLPGLVLLAAAGPLAVSVLRGILPYSTDDSSRTIVDKIAAAPGTQTAVLWLAYLALLTLPLGVLVVGRAAAAARPVLGRIAATLAWLGFTSLFWLAATDQMPLAGASSGAPPGTVASLMDAVNAEPTVSVASLVFVAGHILGTVLLGVALWKVLPRWVAVALIVSQPLHLVFAVVVPNHLLDALAWALTTLGFAWTAAVAGGSR